MYYGFQFSFDFLQFSDSFQLVGVGGGGGGREHDNSYGKLNGALESRKAFHSKLKSQ